RVSHDLGLDDALDDHVDDGVRHEDRDHHPGPALQEADHGGRYDADHEPDVRDVVGDEGEQPPQHRHRDPDPEQRRRVDDRDDETEDRGDDEVLAGAGGEGQERVDQPTPLGGQLPELGGEAGGVDDHEQHQRDDEQEAREHPDQTAHDITQQGDHAAE